MTDFFKFIGEDGDMGFNNGQIYLLTISDHYYKGRRMLSIVDSLPSATMFINVGAFCPYENCEAFFSNWEKV